MNIKQTGFTIVELLIVIVVIGILAAITIVAFNGVQTRANNTVVESNLTNVVKRFELFRAEYGQYPSTAAEYSQIKTSGLRIKSTLLNTMLYCVDTASPNYYILLANGYPANVSYKWTSDGTRNSNSGVAIGSGTTTCQAQMGGVATVAGVWATTFATVE